MNKNENLIDFLIFCAHCRLLLYSQERAHTQQMIARHTVHPQTDAKRTPENTPKEADHYAGTLIEHWPRGVQQQPNKPPRTRYISAGSRLQFVKSSLMLGPGPKPINTETKIFNIWFDILFKSSQILNLHIFERYNNGESVSIFFKYLNIWWLHNKPTIHWGRFKRTIKKGPHIYTA